MDNLESLEQFFSGSALTISQWRDFHQSRVLSGEQRFWLKILEEALNNWKKFRSNPNKSSWKLAKDLPNWPNTDNFQLLSEVVSITFNIDEDIFKSRFIKWMKLDTLPHYDFMDEPTKVEDEDEIGGIFLNLQED